MTEQTLHPSGLPVPLRTDAERAIGVLGRSLVVAVGYVLVLIIGGMALRATGLPVPAMAAQIDPGQFLLTSFIAGLVIGLTLGPLATRLTLPAHERAGLLFGLLVMLASVINMIEALFFTTDTTFRQAYTLLSIAINDAGLAILLTWLFRPAAVDRRLLAALRSTLATRPWAAWIWRILLAGLLYVPIYLFFGSLIAPIVLPYYTNPDLGLGLVIPGFEVILPLEAGRGLLYVLTLFPLVALLPGSRRSLAFWLGLTLAVLGAVWPMLQTSWFPLTMRVVHGLEISADSFVHAAVIAWLLGPGTRREPS